MGVKEDCGEEEAVVGKAEDGVQAPFTAFLRPCCLFTSLVLLVFVCRWFCWKHAASHSVALLHTESSAKGS